MSLIDHKITSEDLENKGNIGMPDTPDLSTAEMQAKLDELSLDVIIPKYNDLVDDLIEIDPSGKLPINNPAFTGNMTGTGKITVGGDISGDDITASGEVTDGDGNKLSEKADADDVYTKTEVDTALTAKANTSNATFTGSFSHNGSTVYPLHSKGVVMGDGCRATGQVGVALGSRCSASGAFAFATGAGTLANGSCSSTLGNGTFANGNNQNVRGKFNAIDYSNQYADIVGGGTNDGEEYRANIETLDWDGNFWVAGEITDGNGITLSDILPTDTVSGNPCVITDAFGGSCKSLSLDIEPIQSGSGTPSPDNVRAISGISSATVTRTGKNIAQLEQGTIDITTGLEVASTSRVRTQYIRVKEGDEYIASSNGWALKNGCAYDESKTFLYSGIYPDISTGKITIPQGVVYVRFVYGNSTNTDCTPSDYNYQFEFGATATPYEAYNGQTITRTYGQTVYGGSDDVTGDGATVTFGYIELDGSDDEGWVAVDSGKRVRTQIINSLVKKNPVSTNVPNIVSSQFEAITPNNSYLGRVGISVDGEGNLLVSDGTSAMVAADWKTYLSGHPLQVAYELATPTTISLASQNIDLLHGDNVITSNAKTVNASYKADVQLYIDKKLSE